MRADFLCPKCDNFACFIYPSRSKWAFLLKKWFGIFCKSITGQFSDAKTHWMVNWLQILYQLDFVWHYTKVFMQNSSQCCLRYVQLLRTTMNWCWWRFKHTFCHSSNVFGFTYYFFGFSRFSLSIEDASFFHFFFFFFFFSHNITNIQSW